MIAELLQLLLETTLAAGGATLLVLALRLPLRRAFGARATYALWLLVPAALLAVMLPSPRVESAVAVVAARAAIASAQGVAAPSAAPSFDATPWLALAWGVGTLAFAMVLARRQRRFRHELGMLQPQPDGSWRAQHP